MHHRFRLRAHLPGVLAAVAFGGQALPAVANPLVPIWNGAYVGAHGGSSWADFDAGNLGSFDRNRATYGGHLGYNFAFGSMLVGVEGDATFAGSSVTGTFGSGGTSVTLDTDWYGSLRARLGFVAGPALLYATAGWAWSGVSVAERTTSGALTGKGSAVFDGVVYGVGAEAFLLPSVSVRFEALRYDYGTERLSFGSGVSALRDLDHGDTVVRAGLTLHFK